MRIRHQLEYEASSDQVYAMLSDPRFRERVCEAANVVSCVISIDGTEAGMSVCLDMMQHTQGIPSFAKRVVGDQTRVIQRETWEAGTGADLEVRETFAGGSPRAATRSTPWSPSTGSQRSASRCSEAGSSR